jgi:hypothetical protein
MEIREIIGNTTATPNPRPDWEQTDEMKADYIKNKPQLEKGTGKNAVQQVGCVAYGNHSFAFGIGTRANGTNSIAGGYNTSTGNNEAVALGSNTRASGQQAFAWGKETLAEGYYSQASGKGAKATYMCSFAHGENVIASGPHQMAIGKYNVENGSALFIIGDGTESNRKNAFEVIRNGGTVSLKVGNTEITEEQLIKILKFIDSIEEVNE